MITSLSILKTWIVARTTSSERGANLVEYILLIAFIALIVVVAVALLQSAISTEFEEATECLEGAGDDPACATE